MYFRKLCKVVGIYYMLSNIIIEIFILNVLFL